ncbi:hypothetical protein [Mycolicibacterium brisbanense]|uniref:Short chain dehydrogenase n=1 Tax=Mycolicibacterium brisbanense TaxID=146020 RepID=A0A100W6F7_9MYCO|nr:hypothetical protein [Mycolicibacterium brisbanense]MCV7157858.1 hypothetical protein [Mycolicibacterium brisbanense]GAS92503.1 short chain dehydrogenase [Mycolicibacterium brisbanense]
MPSQQQSFTGFSHLWPEAHIATAAVHLSRYRGEQDAIIDLFADAPSQGL